MQIISADLRQWRMHWKQRGQLESTGLTPGFIDISKCEVVAEACALQVDQLWQDSIINLNNWYLEATSAKRQGIHHSHYGVTWTLRPPENHLVVTQTLSVIHCDRNKKSS